MSHDISRLPKWAQSRIEVLELNVEHWKGKALAGPDDSDTFLGGGLDGRKPLGTRPTVEFFTGPGRGYQERITARLQENGLLYVTADGMIVRPQASNVITVEIGGRPT